MYIVMSNSLPCMKMGKRPKHRDSGSILEQPFDTATIHIACQVGVRIFCNLHHLVGDILTCTVIHSVQYLLCVNNCSTQYQAYTKGIDKGCTVNSLQNSSDIGWYSWELKFEQLQYIRIVGF